MTDQEIAQQVLKTKIAKVVELRQWFAPAYDLELLDQLINRLVWRAERQPPQPADRKPK